MGASQEQRHRYVDRLLAEAREDLARADEKAELLLAGTGIASGVVLAALTSGDWSPQALQDAFEVVWWGGATLAGVAIALLVATVAPRGHYGRAHDVPTYFGHVAAYRDKAAFEAALTAAPVDEYQRAVDQAWTISAIVVRKYRLIRLALWTLLAAVILLSSAVALDIALAG